MQVFYEPKRLKTRFVGLRTFKIPPKASVRLPEEALLGAILLPIAPVCARFGGRACPRANSRVHGFKLVRQLTCLFGSFNGEMLGGQHFKSPSHNNH